MKKSLLIIGSCLFTHMLMAQEPIDALRYSWTVPGGTARQQAIGGAMGSLGGDLSATFNNPAGLAFYRTGDLVISPFYRFGKNKASYLSRTETDKNNERLALGTTGFVIGSGSGGGQVKNISFSLAYNRSADFNNNLLYRGANNKSSYSQKFLEEIENGNIKDANRVASDFPFGTSLAFNTYWIDTVGGGSSGNYNFQSRAPIATGLLQQQTSITKGGINEFALGVGVNFSDKVYVGGSFGVPVLHYERDATFVEADATEDAGNKFNYASLHENLTTKGVGINLRAGLIFKPHESVRLGLAFLTPTVYNLTDQYAASVTTDTEGYQGVNTQTSEYLSGAPAEYRYSLITPFKVTASASYVLHETADVSKQKGFVTADVDFVNYTSSSFQTEANSTSDQATTDYFHSLNTAIDNAYKSAVNVRVGGELKFTTFMVRGGVAYYGNPYQNINGDKGSKLNLSGGVGYRDNGFFVDLTYVQSINKDVVFPYRLENSPYFGANVRSGVGNVLLTVGFKL